MILLDYPRRARLIIWATGTVEDVENNPELADRLSVPGYKGKVERLITLTIQAYDWNCPQHITPRYTEEEITADISHFIAVADESCENCK